MLNDLLARQLPGISIPSLGSLDPGVLKILIIASLVFLFLMLLAFTRHHIISHSMKGLWAGIFLGVVLVLGLEGGAYYLYSNYILGNKAADLPANFQLVLQDSTKNLTPVLGKAVERRRPTQKEVLTDFESLSVAESKNLKKAICEE